MKNCLNCGEILYGVGRKFCTDHCRRRYTVEHKREQHILKVFSHLTTEQKERILALLHKEME